jgi:hypothetical protein
MPELIVDFPDLNEYHMLLWNDAGTIHMFTGAIGLERMPFEWCSSKDSGATWSEFKFPKIVGRLGPFDAKPISTAFRDTDNTMYMSTDGTGNISLLFASDDNGKTWYDTGGRTHGRHTVFVTRKDNSIFGMGGKKSNIDGYMPSSTSYDKGKTWIKEKTPFAALSSNQRPSLVKLISGRYFFAGDFQTSFKGLQPQGIKQRGAYVALSDNEGKTWHIKKLNTAVPHEGASVPRPPYRHRPDWHIHPHKSGSVGYSVATQSPNGMIHLISSMNHPNLHFEMNEAWILADSDAVTIPEPTGKIESFEQKYPGGKIKATYSAKITEDGRYLLHSDQKWYYDNGKLQWQVIYENGRKIENERLFTYDGKLKSKWVHDANGKSTWYQYWPDKTVKSTSTWQNHKADGTATTYSTQGEVITQISFKNGIPEK